MTAEQWRTVRVTGAQVVADDVLELRLEGAGDDPLPSWAAGAHLEVETTSGIRQYSLCGSPQEAAWTIAVLHEVAGRGGSAHLHASAVVGAELRVRGPRNHFALVADADDYVLVAGGIGITPLKAMAQELHASGRSWRLHYGGRSVASMAYVDEVRALAPDRVHVHPQDEVGLLDLGAVLADATTSTVVYCCGPSGLLEAAALAVADSPAHALHVERFSGAGVAADDQDAGPGEGFVVELAASGLEVAVGPGETILEAVRSLLPDVMSSCEDGYCGTCETRVLDGVPEHRDTVLSPSEQDANDTMMICVGRSRTPRLVLDL